ncbi:MAG: glycoside hydrolase family 25 protein [Novosphingobium sp.]|uniref:glycoside hydrolase family 25 protein n=1 Tax=Novosphingobium sp. TaxID=1874826 RepID=UPI001E18B109|nr:glycoside hydrolase family 25 protein [Novosphingobium sp.]MCB2056970.1 glycoside hydrolase family 25 protein [Novosphingobium sp.]MCP5385790.1 glycoside hydrolase family 25 protein [Novosphingobium sp.]HNJ48488.1 glycoside hydrolase family 25 protein [Novosphingobium sp.]HNN55751.1 glycoside hydrolase family 25 protein [Novosphingobium sp.]
MARKRSGRWRLRLLGAVVLLALLGGGWAWWDMAHWRPSRGAFPLQGVEIGAEDGTVDWKALKAIGADFAYVDASASAFARDPAFVKNLEEARAAGLQTGALHRYDPCQPAESQAANFVTVVPRDRALLPPAVELDLLADDCPVKVGDAAVESELMTFLNQIETHTGKATVLKLSKRFEARYHIAAAIDRNLWLERDRFQPEYAGRPWMLWTANHALANQADRGSVRWVVVQP